MLSSPEFNDFNTRIFQDSIPTLLSDSQYVSEGIALVSEISTLTPTQLAEYRVELYAALHFVSFFKGIEESLEWLSQLCEKGLSGPIAAIAATQVCRRLGDYERASIALRQIYYKTGEHSYVGFYYGQSLAAVGDFSSLGFLSQECLPHIIKTNASREHSRWATLLLDMGLHNFAKEYISTMQPSDLKEYLSQRLKTYSNSASGGIDVKVVNLDSDSRKWTIAHRSLKNAGFHQVERHSAVSGRRLPIAVMRKIPSHPSVYDEIGPGAIGCWLSHYAIWENFANSSQEWIFVTEDDASPYVHASFLNRTWKEINNFDLIWANDRMSGVYGENSKIWNPGMLDNWKQLESWSSTRKGWGTDGYILSKRGAGQLLELTEANGILGHIDGQMGAWSTNAQAEPINRIQSEILKFRQKMQLTSEIRSSSLFIPIVKHNHFGVSATATFKRDR